MTGTYCAAATLKVQLTRGAHRVLVLPRNPQFRGAHLRVISTLGLIAYPGFFSCFYQSTKRNRRFWADSDKIHLPSSESTPTYFGLVYCCPSKKRLQYLLFYFFKFERELLRLLIFPGENPSILLIQTRQSKNQTVCAGKSNSSVHSGKAKKSRF